MRAAVATAAGLASTEVGFALAGWAEVAALAITLVALAAVSCWVLASSARTTRLARLITALRGNDNPDLPYLKADRNHTIAP